MLLIALLLASTASGCGTLYNHEIGPCPKQRDDVCRVYGGVRKDLEEAASVFDPAADEAGHGLAQVALVPLATAFLVVDLPLCAVADTLALPITVRAAMKRPRDAPGTSAPAAQE
jgi:uncharacterized protein YceK